MKRATALSLTPLLLALGCGEPPPPACGDGVLNDREVCDDGNNEEADGCRADCLGEEECGDGFLDPGEECDDGNTQSGDFCRADCSAETCRNGRADPGELCLAGPVELAVPGEPTGLAAGDVDADGDLDLVTASAGFGEQGVAFIENRLGRFVAPVFLETAALGVIPGDIALADVDADGDLDAITTNRGANEIALFKFSKIFGAFAAPARIPAGPKPRAVAAGDLDGDLDADIAASNGEGADTVTVLKNNGQGGFAISAAVPAGDSPSKLAIGLLRGGDPDADIVVANAGGLSFLQGEGGAFPAALRRDVTVDFVQGLALLPSGPSAELEVVTIGGGDVVEVIELTGDGGSPDIDELFDIEDIGSEADRPASIAVGDLDGDGDIDLAATTFRAVHVLKNELGSFSIEDFGGVLATTSIQVGDLNGDGALDLAAASPGGVALLLSRP
jgi:cysteine-rich repeat protein